MIKRLQWLSIFVGVFGLSLLVGCSGDGSSLGPNGTPDTDAGEEPDTEGAGVTLAQLSNDIFTPNCATSGCHGGASRSGGLSLNADVIANEIIGVSSRGKSDVKLIEPNDPTNSYLLRKIEGTDIVGGQMPLGGGRLADEQIAAIRAWIEAGAPRQ